MFAAIESLSAIVKNIYDNYHFKMIQCVFLSILLLCLQYALPKSETLSHAMAIINGVDVFIYDYPFMVYLAISTNEVLCGGTIVNRYSVLTGGICVANESVDELLVVAGWNKERRHIQEREVRRVTLHPEFVVHTYGENTSVLTFVDYNYAVVHLKEPLKYTLAISSVTLATSMDKLREGDPMLVMGWGSTEPRAVPKHEFVFSHLKGTYMNMTSFAECRHNYSSQDFQITDRFFCAWSNTGATCTGDGGGPVLVDKVQFGIISFATGCLQQGFPSVFASVPVVREWILKTAAGCRAEVGGVIIYQIALHLFSQL